MDQNVNATVPGAGAGTNVNPVDIAIATSIDKDLKNCVSTTARSACECTDPQLRQTFSQISQDGIRRQEQLSNLMKQKGIYVPPQADQATINSLMPQLQAATRGLGAATGANVGGQVNPGANNIRV